MKVVAYVLVFGFAAAVGGFIVWDLSRPPQQFVQQSSLQGDAAPVATEKFCGSCHQFPLPETLPQGVWEPTIELMYQLAEQGPQGPKANVAPREEVLQYYLSHAPQRLEPVMTATLTPSPLRFSPRSIGPADMTGTPGIAGITVSKRGNTVRLIACDMFYGDVWSFPADMKESPDPQPAVSLVQLSHPCRAIETDLDGDGGLDLVIADLGSFEPSDQAQGKVVWLRKEADSQWTPKVLLEHVGRVSDLRAADYDKDGDIDFAVAIFGWRKVGQLAFLENYSSGAAGSEFEPMLLDGKTGTVAVEAVDIDHDGDLDLVGLIAQEHETVNAYLNDGTGSFVVKQLYRAPHPAWGFSGMKVVDLDGDGDHDIVLANGDSFDTKAEVIKPYHGVGWLECRPDGSYEYHRLEVLPGAHGLDVGDLDGDGDLDIVAGTFFDRNLAELDSLIWLEQTGPGQFSRHLLEKGKHTRAVLKLADTDLDGDLDIVLGNFTARSDYPPTQTWLDLLINDGK